MSANRHEEEFDDLSKFENKATAHNLPIGWLMLFFGLIIFGIVYTYLYTPTFSGWSQSAVFEESIKGMQNPVNR